MPAFEAIANWIVDYEDNQERLLDIFRRNGISISRMSTNESGSQAVSMMDPFTFFLLIIRSQSKHNLLVDLFHIMRSDAITPADFNGIPDFRDSKKYVFPEDPKLRTAEIGNILWKLFHQARASNIQAETFKQALSIPDTGFVLITLCLYLVCPTNYLPIDSYMRRWLIEHNIQEPKFNWEDYERTLDEVKEISNKPFWQIYDEASTKNFVNGIDSMMGNDGFKEAKIGTPGLNRILYGPPGTGKTYHTTELAVQCVAPDWYYELNNKYLNDQERRELIKAKYDELTAKGRIAFTTFHQSFAYEDFVEGIRAEAIKDEDNKSNISYAVKNGIFKEIANAAAGELVRNNLIGISQEPNVWKISLGQRYETEFRKKCIEAGEARIGWENTGNLNIDFNNRSKDEKKYFLQQSSQKQNSITNFCEGIQVGDIILCLETRTSIEAIGIVTSEYIYKENASNEFSGYPHVREVNWFVNDISLDIRNLNNDKSLEINTCVPLPNLSWINLLEELESHGYL